MVVRIMYALAAALGVWVGTHDREIDAMFPSPLPSQAFEEPSLGHTAGIPLNHEVRSNNR